MFNMECPKIEEKSHAMKRVSTWLQLFKRSVAVVLKHETVWYAEAWLAPCKPKGFKCNYEVLGSNTEKWLQLLRHFVAAVLEAWLAPWKSIVLNLIEIYIKKIIRKISIIVFKLSVHMLKHFTV